MKTNYSIAFIFDKSMQNVLLIKKNRPAFQNGKHNGIGGHVEEGETFREAVAREVEEECGLKLDEDEFLHIGHEGSDYYEMHVYAAISSDFRKFKTLTDEPVYAIDIKSLDAENSIELMTNVRKYIENSLSLLERNNLQVNKNM